VCPSDPLVPWNVIFTVPGEASGDTVNVTAWFPCAGTVKGDAGVLVTPDGSPLTVTLTFP
jgi:hypothetical protein